MVGKVIASIFLGLLALLILLIFAPLVVTIRFKEGSLYVWVRVLGVPIKVFPQKPKKESEAKKKAKEKPEKKPLRKRTTKEWLNLGKRLLASLDDFSKFFLRRAKIRKVELFLPVKGTDAEDTAMKYGQVQAAVGAVRAYLENFLNIKYKRLSVFADFAGRTTAQNIYFSCKIVASPAIIVAALFKGFIRFLILSKKWGSNAPVQSGQQGGQNPRPPQAANTNKQSTQNINANIKRSDTNGKR